MTSAADPATFQSIGPQPVRMLDGSRMVMRGVQGVIGAALLFTAAGLWIAPDASWSQDILLFKLMASIFVGLVIVFEVNVRGVKRVPFRFVQRCCNA